MKKLELDIPPRWRKGQLIFNFLEYLQEKGVATNQNARMADPFHISDQDWDKHFEDFLLELAK